ncbi:MAG: hypothetical protein A2Y23_07575 [Clostridiales bacterium GWB2_37_7]|nr:MAG: hypothetical protein A2Y23_07575 [Clostridiales bacterium GWB2_37_7]
MDFFKDLGKNLGNTAKSVSKKSEELVEITKLNRNIRNEEAKIEKYLLEIGSELYERFTKGEGVDESLQDKCTQIKAIEGTIDVLKEKIKNLKEHNSSPDSDTDRNTDCCNEAKIDANDPLNHDKKENG